MIRTISLVAGLAGATVASQAPEFTQQYLQRLAGQVDALTVVVMDFDRSALAAGLGREEALSQMTGTAFLTARQSDMRRTFARHARLADHLTTLRAASPLGRLAMPHRLADPATFSATLDDFAPALPLTTAGVAAGGGGFLAGWGLLAALVGILRSAVPGRRPKTAPHTGFERREPGFARPANTPALRPVMGERR